MNSMRFLSVVAVVAIIVVIACNKESLSNDPAKQKVSYFTAKDTCIRIQGRDSCFKIYLPNNDTSSHGGHYNDSTYYPGSGRDTCIRINGKDSCFKIYLPSNPAPIPPHGGYHGDSTYYPGGGKDTCIVRNGKDSCFKWPTPVDSSSRKKLAFH